MKIIIISILSCFILTGLVDAAYRSSSYRSSSYRSSSYKPSSYKPSSYRSSSKVMKTNNTKQSNKNNMSSKKSITKNNSSVKTKKNGYFKQRRLNKKYSNKKFQKKQNKKVVVNKTVIKNYDNRQYKTYDNRRSSYYDSIGYSPSGYMYRSYSSFGMWDAMFLWMLLDNINDDKYAKMYYKNINDEAFEDFEKEIEGLSKTNKELSLKLDRLNEKMNKMEGQKIPDNYKIDGMDEDIMYSKDGLKNLLDGYTE